MTSSPSQTRGRYVGQGRRLAIVVSSYHHRVASSLLEGALESLTGHGVATSDIRVVRVPGAWEIPLALEEVAALGNVDAMIALGAVIRGETSHYDIICAECARGVGRVASQYRVPIAFGVLTCETSRQAEERAGGKSGNKGAEAALAALEMAALFEELRA